MRVTRDALHGLASRDAGLRAAHDRDVERSWVAGQVAFFLRNLTTAEDGSELRRQVQLARREVESLVARLAEDESEDLLGSALNQISQQVTRWCADLDMESELGLEYGKYPLRLSLPKLTVIADTDRGPVPMAQVGSAHNRLWLHLATYFALHRWFILNQRPVPRFLMLDHPTQVHAQRDIRGRGKMADLDPENRSRVSRLFDWLGDRVTELDGNLQVIVTDVVELETAAFRGAVVERWWDGAALVPADWPRA